MDLYQYSVVIPAAGLGVRMEQGTPKAFLSVPGLPAGSESICALTVRVFEEDDACLHIVVCAPPLELDRMVSLLSPFRKASVVSGGETRQQSVWNGLYFLCHSLGARDSSTVLIHDAARCLVTHELISRVLEGVKRCGAVTAALPVVEAMVHVKGACVAEDVSREAVWGVQTPQGFLLGEVMTAHERGMSSGTSALDDASLVRVLRQVEVIPGERENVKVTHPNDLPFVAMILRSRHSAQR